MKRSNAGSIGPMSYRNKAAALCLPFALPMTPRSNARLYVLLGSVALLGLLAVPRTASAQANPEKFFFQYSETGTTALPECLPPELVGTFTLLNTQQGTFVETPTGFHIEGSETEAYQVDFPDGRHVVGVAVSRFNFNVSTSGETTFTTAIREPRTIYNAADEAVGTVFIHAISHITYRDLNGNGEPDEGEIAVNVDRFFFTCT